MKKKYKLEDLDCANCAAKMEDAIKAIPGVQSATVSFMAQKLTIEAEEENLESIMEQVTECIRRVDPATRILA